MKVEIVSAASESGAPWSCRRHRRRAGSADRHHLPRAAGGVTADGKTKVKSPSGTLSTAEAIP